MESTALNALKPRKTHGLSGSPTYLSWIGMRQRCHNPNAWNYRNYGGRGIRVCNHWLESFENFLADMGERPSKRHSIGRIDNDSGYTPDNCRWETIAQQVKNKRPADWTRVREERKQGIRSYLLSEGEYAAWLRKITEA